MSHAKNPVKSRLFESRIRESNPLIKYHKSSKIKGFSVLGLIGFDR